MARKVNLVYSSASMEALRKLIDQMRVTLKFCETVDDMFYMGIFCLGKTYTAFDYEQAVADKVMVPDILLDKNIPFDERLDYVKKIIRLILTGQMEKPEWMVYVEENENCSDYEVAPSTFLHLFPKDEKYRKIGNLLIEFLYSPNLMSIFYESNK